MLYDRIPKKSRRFLGDSEQSLRPLAKLTGEKPLQQSPQFLLALDRHDVFAPYILTARNTPPSRQEVTLFLTTERGCNTQRVVGQSHDGDFGKPFSVLEPMENLIGQFGQTQPANLLRKHPHLFHVAFLRSHSSRMSQLVADFLLFLADSIRSARTALRANAQLHANSIHQRTAAAAAVRGKHPGRGGVDITQAHGKSPRWLITTLYDRIPKKSNLTYLNTRYSPGIA
jgi:hypothetical protein